MDGWDWREKLDSQKHFKGYATVDSTLPKKNDNFKFVFTFHNMYREQKKLILWEKYLESQKGDVPY